ncbi:MAG: hypothetical protein HYZ53_26105 [Planctomycetes bacterium]|nr:hypothetical protein [Planctomycetota bacterium]
MRLAPTSIATLICGVGLTAGSALAQSGGEPVQLNAGGRVEVLGKGLDLVALGVPEHCLPEPNAILFRDPPPGSIAVLSSTNPGCAPATYKLISLQVTPNAGDALLNGNFGSNIEPPPSGGLLSNLPTGANLASDTSGGRHTPPPFVPPAVLSRLPDGWGWTLGDAIRSKGRDTGDLESLADLVNRGVTFGEAVARLRTTLGQRRTRAAVEYVFRHRLAGIERSAARRAPSPTEEYVYRTVAGSLAHLDRTIAELK